MPSDLALTFAPARKQAGDGRSLYELDFVRWSEEQAAAIRSAAAAGANLPLDWENLAEEVESLGKSLRSELNSRLGTVVEHLLKLQLSPAAELRRGWIERIGRERVEIEGLLKEDPSLRSSMAESVAAAHRKGRKLAELGLERHDELTPEFGRKLAQARFAERQVLGPWLPDDPDGEGD